MAGKYKERCRWRLRTSFQTANPFGQRLADIDDGLKPIVPGLYAFTGAAAALDTPFIDLDRIDIFLFPNESDAKLRQLDQRQGSGPKLRFIYAYDIGVFMYSKIAESIQKVSNIQTYLDLYARGGRDLKQADYLLGNAIEPGWKAA
jgi:hypothetical protein